MIQTAAAHSRDTLLAIRKPLVACSAIGAGIAIGLIGLQQNGGAALVGSLLVISLFMVLTLYKPLYGLLTWIFFAPFIDSWIEIPLGAGLPDLSFSRFAVFFLLTALLLPVLSGRRWFAHVGLTDLCLLLMPLTFGLSARLSTVPMNTMQTALSLYFIPASAYFLAKHLVEDRKGLHQLLWIMSVLGSIAGAHALYEAFTGHIIFLSKEQEIVRLYRGETNLRLIVGLIGETGAMARVLGITLLVTLYLILESKEQRLKPLLIGGAGLQFGGLFITFSRTPLIACLVALLILQFFYPQLRRVLVMVVMLTALGLAVNWQAFQQTQVAQDRLSGLDTYNGRTERWQAGLAMWRAKPILGWGVGQFEAQSGQYRLDSKSRNLQAVENDFLFVLVSAGLVGFLPYLLFLLTSLFKSFRLFLQAQRQDWAGFVQPPMVLLYWVVILSFLICAFTAKNAFAIERLLPFVLAGAIVGSQEDLLRRAARAPWQPPRNMWVTLSPSGRG